jgi:tRNA pseudouridine13 synthase
VHTQEYDALIGMRLFTTSSQGIGGRLRKSPADFIVQEIGLDGSIAPLEASDDEFVDTPGKFAAFFLVKRNLETIQAIRRLSKALGVSYKRFSYAGMKDRRAVTSQRASYRGPPHDLIGREIPRLMILHPHRVPKPIVPGALEGNRFTIVVREIALEVEEVTRLLNQTQQEITRSGGVLNFFGPQRFGIMRPNTHLVGKQIVLENYEQAVQILLENRESEETTSQVLDDASHGSYERAIIHYLNKHPGEYKESFQILPRDLVRLYIHAYQSYLFNLVISERVTQGIPVQEPIIGDYTIPISGEIHAVRPVTKASLPQVQRAVTNGTHKLVIPIIGYDFEHVQLDGTMGELYQSIFESEKIVPSQFRLSELPALSSRGTFRALLVNPRRFKVTVLEDEGDTPVQVQFDLPKGSYASVILREFIKPDSPTQL